jgi:choline dehydrogenase
MHADYVIVGAGSAGCAMAYRLAEAGKRVTVIEHGGVGCRAVHPDAGRAVLSDEHGDLRLGLCHRTRAASGRAGAGDAARQGDRRVVSINGMVYVRGHARDYDTWAEMGADGWSYADVLPYFKRMEHSHGGSGPEFRGTDGPLHITRGPRKNPLVRRLHRGGRQAGYPVTSRLQRSAAGRLWPDGGDDLEGPALVGGECLSETGDGGRQCA